MIDLLPAEAVHQLEQSLSTKRFHHSGRVLETAFQIAEAWNHHPIDRSRLAWAALFHDCAKELKRQERERYLQIEPIDFGEELMNTPGLVHAPLGAALLRSRYGIDHPSVLKAVAYHPTGHPSLDTIGYLVYAADYLEPGRTNFPERAALLEAVKKNPLDGLRRIAGFRIQRVQESQKSLNETAMVFQNYLESIDEL